MGVEAVRRVCFTGDQPDVNLAAMRLAWTLTRRLGVRLVYATDIVVTYLPDWLDEAEIEALGAETGPLSVTLVSPRLLWRLARRRPTFEWIQLQMYSADAVTVPADDSCPGAEAPQLWSPEAALQDERAVAEVTVWDGQRTFVVARMGASLESELTGIASRCGVAVSDSA